MSDRERSRSRSRSPAPDNGAANNGPPDDKPHVDGGGGEDADGIRLYVGNLDYGAFKWVAVDCLIGYCPSIGGVASLRPIVYPVWSTGCLLSLTLIVYTNII